MPTLTLTTHCPDCGSTSVVEVDAEGFAAWKAGELIQRALPSLSDDDRERLKTGICPACWEAMFPEEEEEEGGS